MEIDKETIICNGTFYKNVKSIKNAVGDTLLVTKNEKGQPIIINPKIATIKEVFIINEKENVHSKKQNNRTMLRAFIHKKGRVQ